MTSVRSEIERNVWAYHGRINNDDDAPKTRIMPKAELDAEWNKRISEMPIIELLRYAHPDERSRLADKAIEAGLLTKEEGREFIRFVR